MMKHVFMTLLIGFTLPFSGCAQKKQANATTKQTDDVKVVALSDKLNSQQVLETIIKTYKGKVAVIDYWATWCGPCRAAMKQIDPIKESYLKNKKDVAFVYITGETSPLPTWKEAIKTIKGFHYRLSDNQFNNLLKSLGIMGIPTYMIVGKDGKITYDNKQTGGYPGDDVIKEEIDKALGK